MPPSFLELDITGLCHDGRGIARRPDAPVVFVSGALPGERVRASVVRRKSAFWEAEAVDSLRPASCAVPPPCPHAAHCGGCPLMGMNYPAQLWWKRTLALDALERIGGFPRSRLDSLLDSVLPSPALTAFRNKMEFAFGQIGGALRLGLRRRSHASEDTTVMDVPGCVLMPPEAQAMVALARQLAGRSGFAAFTPPGRGKKGASGFWRFFILRRGLAADERSPAWWALCLTSPGSAAQRDVVRRMGDALLAAFPDLAAFLHEERSTADALPLGQRRILTLTSRGQSARLRLPLAGRIFSLDAASFFQVNTAGAQVLARTALTMFTDKEKNSEQAACLLDLYCGVGAPGLLLAPAYASLFGVERDTRAVSLARANARAFGFSTCRYRTGDAADLQSASIPGGLCDALVDPPRAGLSSPAVRALIDTRPRRILYLSCNPSTLARDARLLAEHYTMEQLAAVDLFPHTPHLECLTLWQKQNNSNPSGF